MPSPVSIDRIGVLLIGLVAWPVAWAAHQMLGLSLVIASPRDALAFFLLGPILEEWLLRHELQRGLTRRLQRPHLANSLCALVFALLHWPGHGNEAWLWLIPGLALGELWRRQQSLLLNILMHAWLNMSLWLVS